MIPILKEPKVQFQTLEMKSFSAMKEILDRWYLCPVCGTIARGWFYSEKLPIEGDPEPAKLLKREFGLTCRHKFKAEFPEGPISFVPESPLKVAHKDLMFMYLQFETKTKDGIIVQRLLQRSDSYVSNMIAFLSCQAHQPGGLYAATNIYEYVPDITSTAVTAFNDPEPDSNNFILYTVAGSTTNGIAVGTGTTANSPTTGALAAPIGNGTGAGQLSYGDHTFTAPVISGSTTSFTFSRPFTNNSGASITISEVGAFDVQLESTGVYQTCLVFRDVLATSITVANTATTTATYTIGVTTS
jgi:hypothetical protein